MAERTFDFGKRDYLDRLNDLEQVYMPSVSDALLLASRGLSNADNGYQIDCGAALTLTPDTSTQKDGWSVFVNAIAGGTVTINAAFVDGTTSKTVTVGNSAVISYRAGSSKYRIARMVAT